LHKRGAALLSSVTFLRKRGLRERGNHGDEKE
jgi:hypothetical protein